eukprot:Gregarina_sp_Poly_1__2484@NODE_1673_length_3555_cov_25_373280_g1099_i0_p2_GENE_NODE_1673_length_3555_cov_25_373280_g1099_i0NODE_1673_length_3555_cov_25_373280_g1099_i0_p2_ORF_typecomplete_len104_score1_61_NODE_1673_length_3555_cov_25_373280_g1099_i024562767
MLQMSQSAASTRRPSAPTRRSLADWGHHLILVNYKIHQIIFQSSGSFDRNSSEFAYGNPFKFEEASVILPKLEYTFGSARMLIIFSDIACKWEATPFSRNAWF